jgi:hypothetical protein
MKSPEQWIEIIRKQQPSPDGALKNIKAIQDEAWEQGMISASHLCEQYAELNNFLGGKLTDAKSALDVALELCKIINENRVKNQSSAAAMPNGQKLSHRQ